MANLNHTFIFVLCGFFVFLVLQEVSSTNCELKARINKAFKELPMIEEVKHHSHKTLGNPLHSKRSTSIKRTNRESIPQLAKNIESFLQKVIPNHGLVQDLMGYITMPNPNARKIQYRYSLSTLISWQHFPRSTSSRSRCDESEEGIATFSETKSLTPIKEEKESIKSSTGYPITKSFSQLNALHYLEVRHVFELLNFLISHLVCNEPQDPVQFLVELLFKCLKFRDFFGDPPNLFTQAHLKSLYNAFDPFERGHITLNQYKEAMKSLGLENSITPYNQEPSVNEDDLVEENYFIFEAERCLTENLKQMLRIPNLWEENRLLWKKKMEKLKPPIPEKESKIELEAAQILEVKEERDSKYSDFAADFFARCSRDQQIMHEPEQLFLN